jgi:hypothetical protein
MVISDHLATAPVAPAEWPVEKQVLSSFQPLEIRLSGLNRQYLPRLLHHYYRPKLLD